jgi:hypothetical protein
MTSIRRRNCGPVAMTLRRQLAAARGAKPNALSGSGQRLRVSRSNGRRTPRIKARMAWIRIAAEELRLRQREERFGINRSPMACDLFRLAEQLAGLATRGIVASPRRRIGILIAIVATRMDAVTISRVRVIRTARVFNRIGAMARRATRGAERVAQPMMQRLSAQHLGDKHHKDCGRQETASEAHGTPSSIKQKKPRPTRPACES